MFFSYIGSYKFRSTSAYFIFFAICLIGPSLLYFIALRPGFIELFESIIQNPDEFGESRNKFLEIQPWITIAITAILVMASNTVVYFIAFVKEMVKEKNEEYIRYYYGLLCFFGLWILLFLGHLGYTSFEFYELRSTILGMANQTVLSPDFISDSSLTKTLTEFLNEFIDLLEDYIMLTIVLFIAIDSVSLILKQKQIGEAWGKKEAELNYERDFILNQLIIIDIPVLIGIFLIYLFRNNLSDIDINDTDAKAVFTVGGIAMHIILSQIIFLVLAFKNSFRLYRLGNK